MALPKQVEQQLKDVEELEKQFSSPAEEAKVEQPEVAESPAEVHEPQPAAPAVAKPDVWEQKYSTLQGMYNAEVPRLHAQVKELTAELQKLQQVRETPPQEAKPSALVTQQDIDAFGEDLLDVQRRVAREVAAEFGTKLEKLEQENAQLRESLTQTGTRINTMSFEQRLASAVPDFEAVNANPAWAIWLDEVDPILRGPRRAVAQQAFSDGDAEAVAHYVRLFREATGTPKKEPRQAELERQIAPSRGAATGTTSSSSAEPVYTTAQVDKMYSQVRSLTVQQRFDEAAKLEAKIDAAYMEGRVR